MLPKNSKHHIVPTAEMLGKDTHLVEDVISFYYATVRKCLIEMKGNNILVDSLGTFRPKKKEIPKLIDKYNRHLSVLTKDTFGHMQIRNDIAIRLERLTRLQSQLEKEKLHKQTFMKLKRERDGK